MKTVLDELCFELLDMYQMLLVSHTFFFCGGSWNVLDDSFFRGRKELNETIIYLHPKGLVFRGKRILLEISLMQLQGAKTNQIYRHWELMLQILPPRLKRSDFEKVLSRQKPTVSKADLEVHERFTKEFGEEG